MRRVKDELRAGETPPFSLVRRTPTQAVNAAMKIDGACYRTGATVAQVNDFYKKQPETTEVHTSAKGGMFKKGTVNITVQSPWMNMKTGQHMTDTLISIVKTQ